jgi:hypothetical protein
LQLWGDLRPERGVLSVEPCTSERLEGGLSGEEPILEPGRIRRYALSVSIEDWPAPEVRRRSSFNES